LLPTMPSERPWIGSRRLKNLTQPHKQKRTDTGVTQTKRREETRGEERRREEKRERRERREKSEREMRERVHI